MQFTDQPVPQQPWGVITEYIAIELTTGAILSPLDSNRINSPHGPLGANSRGANWVWCELTPPISQEIVKGLYNLASAARQPDPSTDALQKKLDEVTKEFDSYIAKVDSVVKSIKASINSLY